MHDKVVRMALLATDTAGAQAKPLTVLRRRFVASLNCLLNKSGNTGLYIVWRI
jgi:hypothetical protein